MSIPRQGTFRANDLHPSDLDVLLESFKKHCRTSGPDDCWLWGGSCNRDGYGVVTAQTRQGVGGHLAHRVAWVLASNRALTDDLTIDHLCRVKACVNPAHLEPVTFEENFLRMLAAKGLSPRAPKKPSVPAVRHEVDPTNARRRICPSCRVAYSREYVAAHIRRMHPEVV